MRMLVDKIWFLMSEMNRGPVIIYHRTCLHLKKTKRVGQMDDFRIQIKIVPLSSTVTKFEGSTYPKFNRFPDFNRVSHNRTKFIIIPFFFFPVPVNKISLKSIWFNLVSFNHPP